jgi:hypothetical protein
LLMFSLSSQRQEAHAQNCKGAFRSKKTLFKKTWGSGWVVAHALCHALSERSILMEQRYADSF